MKKYKLLYFVSEDEYFLSHKIDQARSVLKSNYEILVVSKFHKNEKKIQKLGFKTRNLDFNRKSINPFNEIIRFLHFCVIIFSYKPDLIQSFALKPILYSALISKFVRKTKIIMCVVGLGYLFINKKTKTKVIKKIYLTLLRFFLRKKDIVFVFQNNDDKKEFIKNKITGSSKIKIVKGSGIDIRRFKKKKVKKIYDLIFHSRILYDKGFLELIEAIKSLKNKRKISVLVLGSPDQSNRSSIKTYKLRKWEKERLIIWKQKKTNVIPYLQRSKIAILPSYREGLPKSLLEAASCELPIISTNVVGCREICLNNFNGLLVPPKDSISISVAIEKILSNPKLSNFYGKNGRELIKEKFSNTIIQRQFLKIYEECLLK